MNQQLDFDNRNKSTGVGKILAAVIITIVICCLLFFIFYYFILKPRMVPAEDERYARIITKLKALDEKIDDHYLFETDEEAMENNLYLGYVYALNDDYADYYSAEEYEEYITAQQGNFTGIGVRVIGESGILANGIFVYRVLGNSPAEEVGMQVGDEIIAVDGKSIIGTDYDEAINKIRGLANTTVSITVERGDEIINFDIVRRTFIQKEVEFKVIDGNIGFIRIHEFNTNAFSEFCNAINDLLAQNVKGFIIDLRNNPGGELQTVVNMVDCLVEDNQEIAIIATNDEERVLKSTSTRLTDLPVVILINEGSASASELFASALRDLNGALLVGKQTFGKQIGQTTFMLYDDSAVKMTTFRYYTASRTDYNKLGLVPDNVVDLDDSVAKYFYSLDEEQDNQLGEAIRVIKGIIK